MCSQWLLSCCVVRGDTGIIWSAKPKIFTLWCFTVKICQPPQALQRGSEFNGSNFTVSRGIHVPVTKFLFILSKSLPFQVTFMGTWYSFRNLKTTYMLVLMFLQVYISLPVFPVLNFCSLFHLYLNDPCDSVLNLLQCLSCFQSLFLRYWYSYKTLFNNLTDVIGTEKSRLFLLCFYFVKFY